VNRILAGTTFLKAGGEPLAGVVRDASGTLYGTTPTGGRESFGGVVYKVKGK
jgi:hypothetical protein